MKITLEFYFEKVNDVLLWLNHHSHLLQEFSVRYTGIFTKRFIVEVENVPLELTGKFMQLHELRAEIDEALDSLAQAI